MTEDERFAEIASGIHTAILAAADTPEPHGEAAELVRRLHILLDDYVIRFDSNGDHNGALVARYKASRQAGMLKPEHAPKHA